MNKTILSGVTAALFFLFIVVITSTVTSGADGSESGLYIPSVWDHFAMLLWEPIFLIVVCGSILGIAVWIRIRKLSKIDDLLDVK